MTTGSSTRSARRRCWLVTWTCVDGAVEQRRHGVAAHPDVRLHREPLELCLHLRCLHAQPDYDPYMSIRSQQHNLIMCATCIHEHGQFRSMMHDAWIFILFLGIINDHPHTDRSDLSLSRSMGRKPRLSSWVMSCGSSLLPARHRHHGYVVVLPFAFRQPAAAPPPCTLSSFGGARS